MCICVHFEIVHVASLVAVISCSPFFSECVLWEELKHTLTHSRAGVREVEVGYQGGPGYAFWKETLYPAATLASHSTSCLPASLHLQSCPVMPAVNGHRHTHLPLPGWEGVSSSTSPFILCRRKSFRFLSCVCVADRRLHVVTAQ